MKTYNLRIIINMSASLKTPQSDSLTRDLLHPQQQIANSPKQVELLRHLRIPVHLGNSLYAQTTSPFPPIPFLGADQQHAWPSEYPTICCTPEHHLYLGNNSYTLKSSHSEVFPEYLLRLGHHTTQSEDLRGDLLQPGQNFIGVYVPLKIPQCEGLIGDMIHAGTQVSLETCSNPGTQKAGYGQTHPGQLIPEITRLQETSARP